MSVLKPVHYLQSRWLQGVLMWNSMLQVLLLFASFAVQILRWQSSHTPPTPAPPPKRRASKRSKTQQQESTTASAATGTATAPGKAEVVLTLKSPSEEPAALAVLSSLYGVKPIPELLSELSQGQQLQAAVLADLWQVPDVSTAVVEGLTPAVSKSASGLSEDATKYLMRLGAYPAFLMPLIKSSVQSASSRLQRAANNAAATQVLVGLLGDLEAVWGSAELRELLLGLPVDAMVALLSSDELQVGATTRWRSDSFC